MENDICVRDGLPSRDGDNKHGGNEYDGHLHLFKFVPYGLESWRGAIYGEIFHGIRD